MRPALFAVALSATCALLSSCYPSPRLAPIWPVVEPVSNYAPGETLTAAPGLVMVDRTDGSLVLPGFLLTSPLRVIGTDRLPPVEAGLWSARFEYRGSCPDGFYVLTNPYFYEERVGIVVSREGRIACDSPVVQLVGGKRGRTWDLDEQLPIQPFTPVPYVAGFEADAVRWQLLYSGRSGNTVTLEYREFRNGAFDDDAVPAYQQQVTYDLGASKTITFQNTLIQVVSANNREITFRVVRDDARATRMPPRAATGGRYEGDSA